MASTRVFFEEADRPPPAYFQPATNDDNVPLKVVPFQTPDPQKWISATEFVPRSKLLQETFDSCDSNSNYSPNCSIQTAPFAPFSTTNDPPYFPPPLFPTPMPPNIRAPAPLTGIPPGYTANMTTINPSNGPPIAAILLRKKRKRRSNHKSNTNSMVDAAHSISPCSSHPSDPNGDTISSGDDKNLSGSCPDLSDQQIQKWDDYLFDTAKTANEAMKSSFYEIAPPGIIESAKQTIYGTANEELQKLDNEINGNTMTSSMVLKRLANHTYHSDGCTEKTLADEMNELTFRPQVTKYGYPQIDCNESPYVHITSMDPKSNKVKNSIIDKEALKAYLDEQADEEEDYLEGLNITVNNFDNCDDLTLADIEQPTRFQQIQEAIRRNTLVVSTDLKAPDRVCCLIM